MWPMRAWLAVWGLVLLGGLSGAGSARVGEGPATDLTSALPRMVGKSREQLQGADATLLEFLIAPDRQGMDYDFAPFRLWDVWERPGPDGQRQYLVLHGAPTRIIPGQSWLRLSLLETNGRVLWSFRVPMGWRLVIGEVTLTRDVALGGWRLAVDYARVDHGGPDIGRVVLVLAGDELLTVRVENASGHATRNIYEAPNAILGPEPSGGVASWRALLDSDRPERQLAALVYLAGFHLRGERFGGGMPALLEHPGDVDTVRLLRADKEVRQRIEALKQSPHPWVREEAELAAKPMPDGW